MLSYQQNFFSPTSELTADRFAQLVVSDYVVGRIKGIRQLRRQAREKRVLIEANPDPAHAMNMELEQEAKALEKQAAQLKRQLPGIAWQATFDETLSKSGIKGRWRKQSACRLNGLYMLDIDHLPDPAGWFSSQCADGAVALTKQAFCENLGVLLVHVTPSGEGLRLVARADASRGNLSDNQHWLAQRLKVGIDEACKDATRLSFCPMFDDILYINKEKLFDYENKEFDEKYGKTYRMGHSAATRDNGGHSAVPADAPDGGSDAAAGTAGDDGVGSGRQGSGGVSGSADVLDKEYYGTTYRKIIECWLDVNAPGWQEAIAGQSKSLDNRRHLLLLQMAGDLRYICDKKDVYKALVQESPLGAMLRGEGDAEEVDRIADHGLRYRLWREIPQRLRTVLERAGVREYDNGNGAGAQKPRIDYDAWWRRLQPLLDESPYLRDACALLPPHHRIGGVLASGAMFGTYLSRCWWQHFDGKAYRMSYIVYVIGDAASGKSAMVDLDRLIMAPMLASDKVGREWERQYKEEMKARAASSKNAKKEAPEQQHPVIRYLPSTISNAMLYRRLTDAIDKECTDAHGDPLHLHCYTFEAELATALRAQQGSWAGKLDLECKSFQNEMAGVDYANDQSQNGIIEINWNQVITGTPDALRRKIRKATVLDGLVTRLCVFPMPSNDYAMIERRQRIIEHERDCRLRSAGIDLEKIAGELECERLVDFCYDYEVQLTEQARANEDRCLDYFRKRIPVIMMRYALVRAVLRQLKELKDGQELKIEDSDLEFARLVGDFVLEMQMYMFGTDVMEALEAQAAAFVPRRRSNKVKERFDRLGARFTREQLAAEMPESSPAAVSWLLGEWVKHGIVAATSKTAYKKLVNDLN